MVIRFGGFKLRPWRVGDEFSLSQNANNRNVWRNLRDLFPHPYTLDDAKAWIKTASKQKPQTNFAVEVDSEAVGNIGLTLQDDVHHRSATLGYWLGEKHWNHGIMTQAVQAITDFGFSNFDLCRIYATVYEWNLSSMRVLEKAGYEREAILKKSITKEDQTIDEFIYATIR